MFEEGVIDLIENGVITNLKKKFLPGKLVTSFVMARIFHAASPLFQSMQSSLLLFHVENLKIAAIGL